MTGISPLALAITILIYVIILYIVSHITSKGADTSTFFNANKKSPWMLVAIGMIGASLSGVTFISIPGMVGGLGHNMAFSYFQVVLGYLVGYAIIATVLMPVYYRMHLTTIYGYLEDRFGAVSHKMGAFYFLLSRILGASLRLYLVAIVLHPFILKPMGISFEITVLLTLCLIWVYTFKGGIKTIVWTDTIQTITMLLAVILTVLAITQEMQIGVLDIKSKISDAGFSKIFFFENGWSDANNFFKQFLSGALIAIVMTGLDQDMMQKNLTCKNLKDAQKNMFVFSIILIFANILFLTLGALLYLYAAHLGVEIPVKSDQLYPMLAINHLSPFIGIVFIVGLVAAAYSSADSALTALTTSYCIDFLDFNKKERTESQKRLTRLKVHVGFTVILFVMIMAFNALNNDAVVNALFKIAGYTYGPLLGMFAFGLMTKKIVIDRYVWVVVLLSPIISAGLDKYSEVLFGGFKFGFTILAVNGLITFLGFWILSKRSASINP